jgi:hypothetical protein
MGYARSAPHLAETVDSSVRPRRMGWRGGWTCGETHGPAGRRCRLSRLRVAQPDLRHQVWCTAFERPYSGNEEHFTFEINPLLLQCLQPTTIPLVSVSYYPNMRLLELQSNGDVSLTKDLLSNIPPYAILSHTWGDDEDEVTFKDLTEGSGKTKHGYNKILFCAKQARNDGLQHIWIDTCCIDKSNNAELSEAIISMFRWYRNAAKCYVYLVDVSTTGQDPIEQRWAPAF